MENDNQQNRKSITGKRIVSTLTFSCLFLAVSGCNSNLIDNKHSQTTTNNPAKTNNKPIPDKTTNNSPLILNNLKNNTSKTTSRGDSKDKHTLIDDSASTLEGVAQVVNANNQFAISLYQRLHMLSNKSDNNVFFSPYSLSTAMSMLYAAAQGETKQQIQQTFYYPALNTLNPNIAALHNQFNSPKSDYKLSTVNDLWIQKGLNPNQNYVETVERYYGGKVTELDFKNDPDPSRQTINKTIATYTNKMVPELLPNGSIERDTTTVLTNAVYFKGDWQMPFSLNQTSDKPFYPFEGQPTNVKMMYKKVSLDYTEDKDVQVVKLPYKGNELSMLVILPKSKDKVTMQKLVKNLSTTQISQWTNELKKKEVMLDLPKFKLEESYQMKTLLADMGMPAAFDDRADFSLFNEELPLKVDSIFHKAVVEIDETGTEAAAATGMVISPLSASYNVNSVEFIANHPFIFIIKDNKMNVILFLGQMNKP